MLKLTIEMDIGQDYRNIGPVAGYGELTTALRKLAKLVDIDREFLGCHGMSFDVLNKAGEIVGRAKVRQA